MEKLSEAASRVVIARPRRGRGNLGKALPEWERHRRPYTPPDLTVAALPAQPLAALPPYGCGVPLAGSERHTGLQQGRHSFYGARPPDLSLRGRFAPVAISGRQLRFRRKYPIIRPSTARFPRRFAPRNDTSGWRAAHQCPYAVEFPHTGRSLPARGTPHP